MGASDTPDTTQTTPAVDTTSNVVSTSSNLTTFSSSVSTADLDIELRAELEKKRLVADIDIARRRQKIEEMRVEHQIDIENRIQDFNEADALRRHKLIVNTDNQSWMRIYWRPAMGWCWLFICLFDFVIAPMIMMLLPVFVKGMTYTPWQSLTMANGGMIHMAFGGVLGVHIWQSGRQNTQIAGLMNGQPNQTMPNNRAN